MAIVDSRVRKGTLTLGGTSFACQAKAVSFQPPDLPTGDDDEEVLCGDPLPPEGDSDASWKLKITAIQDFDNPLGFVVYTLQHKGDEVPFVWTANDQHTAGGGTPFGASGLVKIWPGEIGGDVKKRLELPVELPITSGEPVWQYPVVVPPAAWTATTAYALGARVTITGGVILEATTAGTSDDVEPVAPGAVGGTVVDGTVVWTRRAA